MPIHRSHEEQAKLDSILAELFQFIMSEPDKSRYSFVSWLIKEIAFQFGLDVKVLPELDSDKVYTHLRYALWGFEELCKDSAQQVKAFELIHEFLHDLLWHLAKNR